MYAVQIFEVEPPEATVKARVWYLNNPSRPLLHKGEILDWQYCDTVFCGNAGATGCHGCSNWRENRNNSKAG